MQPGTTKRKTHLLAWVHALGVLALPIQEGSARSKSRGQRRLKAPRWHPVARCWPWAPPSSACSSGKSCLPSSPLPSAPHPLSTCLPAVILPASSMEEATGCEGKRSQYHPPGTGILPFIVLHSLESPPLPAQTASSCWEFTVLRLHRQGILGDSGEFCPCPQLEAINPLPQGRNL